MHEGAPEFSIHVEDIVDPVTKKPMKVEEGVIGEAVLTTLDREDLSFIKYATGDVIQIFTKPCPCGYPGPGYRYYNEKPLREPLMTGRDTNFFLTE